jgi:hypothetical protein
MSEIDAMKSIETAFAALDEAAQKRVLDWAWARYVQGAAPSTHGQGHSGSALSTKQLPAGGASSPAAKKGKKSKVIPKQVMDLNLSPSGKQSGKAFADAKAPTNVKQKCVVAIYYLRDTVGLPAVTADHVFTFFKNVGWPAPTDLINTLQQAGSAGWLDSANSEDLKITPIGENLIEHELSTAQK